MDFNAGSILDGQPLEAAAEALLAKILAAASGQATASEVKGFREGEIAPWLPGETI